jgi:hypothetical protein
LAALGFELRASHLLGRWSTLKPLLQPFFVMGFLETRSHELSASGWFPTVILLSGWDYRHEPGAQLYCCVFNIRKLKDVVKKRKITLKLNTGKVCHGAHLLRQQ